MKRVNLNDDEGEIENSGSKKIRVFNESDVNLEIIGNDVTMNIENAGLGGLEEANKWDFDINFDLIFGTEEQQNGLGFDLNVPLMGTDDGCKKHGFDEYTEKGSLINDKIVEIIDILSDDSDNEVEIIGESSSLIGGERPYTREEKGKTHINDLLLPLNLGFDLNLYHDSENSLKTRDKIVETIDIQSDDSDDEVEIIGESRSMIGGERTYAREENHQIPLDLDLDLLFDGENLRNNEEMEFIVYLPEGAPDMPEPELVRDLAQEQLLMRRQVRIKNAKQIARPSCPEEKDSPVLKAVEQLGNLPGPFSEALKVVRQRTSKRSAHQLIEWKRSEENVGKSVILPSLLDLSLKGLAENAGAIVSLELIPDLLRRRLADVICDTGRMNVDILNLYVKGCPSEIRIKNCSWLTEQQFQGTLGKCQMENMRVLQLDLCGQIMLDFEFRDILSRSITSFSNLAIVSLRGACRLTDNGLKKLVESAPKLQSINVGQCTLLTCDAINFIADSLGSNLRELYIDDCHKIDAMLILPAFKKFEYLEVLSVAEIQTVTDQFISEVINICGKSIKEIDLANCMELTDCSLKTIGGSCVDLRSLNLSNMNNLTDFGLESLANGCRSIQKLKLCRNKFSDEAMAAFLECSGESLTELLLNNVTKVGPNTALSLSKCSRNLLSLDISWCRGISNEAIGLIVDSCASLKLLKVFGFRQITSVFASGNSNSTVRIIGLNMSPIMENLNLFNSEEVFLRYSHLPICTT